MDSPVSRDATPPSSQTDIRPPSATSPSPTAPIASLPGGLSAALSLLGAHMAKGRKPAFFLDFDGTLSHIVANPQEACLAPRVEDTLRKLSTVAFTSIITGRKRATIQRFVPVRGLTFGCSHGVDIFGPAIKPHCAAGDYLPLLRRTRERLAAVAAGARGAHVEDNEFSLTVHYRKVAEGERAQLRERVEQVVDEANAEGDKTLFMGAGNNVFEIKPDNSWHKGSAVEYVMRTLEEGTVPVFVGDDLTDENGFQAMKQFGGVGIIVHDAAKDDMKRARETAATVRLTDPDEVGRFLAEMSFKIEDISVTDGKTAS